MFEQTFVEGANTTRKASSVFVSFLIQCGLVVVAVLIPLIYYGFLPKTQLTSFLVAPPPPPPPPPPPAAAPVKVVKVVPRQFDAGRLMAPKQIPKDIAMIKEDDLPPAAAALVSSAAFRAAYPAALLAASLEVSSAPFRRQLRLRRLR